MTSVDLKAIRKAIQVLNQVDDRLKEDFYTATAIEANVSIEQVKAVYEALEDLKKKGIIK